MNIDEAETLREHWGDKHCDHPDIIAERGTIDDLWRCIQCGRLVNFEEWEALQKLRR